MMRKIILLIILLLVILVPAFSSSTPFSYIFYDSGYHGSFCNGLFPSYILNGFHYHDLKFLEDHTTTFSFRYYTGLSSRALWYDPSTKEIDLDSELSYDILRNLVDLKLYQNFGPVDKPQLFSITLGSSFLWEASLDSQNAEKGIDELFARLDPTLYPDLTYSTGHDIRHHLNLNYSIQLTLNNIKYNGFQRDGDSAYIYFETAPKLLNQFMLAPSDYYKVHFNFKDYRTLYSQGDDLNVILNNDFDLRHLGGNNIPTHAQGSVALGNQIHGYSSLTYNTNYSVAYTPDITVYGPKLFNTARPRIVFYYSVGHNWGEIINTNTPQSEMLMSTGFKASINFFDFVDFNFKYYYLIHGTNYGMGIGKKHNYSFYMYFNMF